MKLTVIFVLFSSPVSLAASVSGKISGPDGAPMGGAWVSLIENSIAARPRVTVITGEDGKFQFPEHAKAKILDVRLRRYGFQDKWLYGVKSNQVVDFQYSPHDVLDAKGAASQLPSHYWLSLLDAPSNKALSKAAETTKTIWFAPHRKGGGDFTEKGGGQRLWLGGVRYQCSICHQIGDAGTRWPRSKAEWNAMLVLTERHKRYAEAMNRDLLIEQLSAWSKKIAAGELPKEKPDIPTRHAGKVKFEEWEFGSGYSLPRDPAVAYRWDLNISALGADKRPGWVYILDMGWDKILGLKPETGELRQWPISFPTAGWSFGSWPGHPLKNAAHYASVDEKGRLVMAVDVSDEDSSKGYKSGNRDIGVFDPSTGKWNAIMTKCDVLILEIDKKGRYWIAGNVDEICMYDPKLKKEFAFKLPQHDGNQSLNAGEMGQVIGIDTAPDGAVWYTHRREQVGRFDPETNTFKVWNVPAPATMVSYISVDQKGRAWIPFRSGHLGMLEPGSEKIKLWTLPGPQRATPPGAHDLPYAIATDKTGVWKDVFIIGGASDGILRFDPDTEKFEYYQIPSQAFHGRRVVLSKDAVWVINSQDLTARFAEKDPHQDVARARIVKITFEK